MNWINNVVEYIEANLENAITIEEVAKVSGFSTRHVQRAFREQTGDSVMAYVRGRRLTCAMHEIASSDRSLLDLALSYQFESQESFTRAFRTRFISPPKRFRNSLLSNPPSAKLKLTENYLDMIQRGEITLEPRIFDRPEKHFVGVRSFESLNSFGQVSLSIKITELAKELRMRKHEIEPSELVSPEEPGVIILCYGAPPDDSNKRKELVLMVALETSSPIVAPTGMDAITTPHTKHAKFVHSGDIRDYPLASSYVAGNWFPRSKYWIGNAPLVNYVQIKGLNSSINKSVFIIPLRKRSERLRDPWWEDE